MVHNKYTHRLWGYGSVGQLLNIVLVTLRRAGTEWLPGHILVKSWILAAGSKSAQDIYFYRADLELDPEPARTCTPFEAGS